MKLTMPGAFQAQILQAARAATPAECCGLILGRREGEDAVALGLHAARNLAAAVDRFEVAPADQFAAQRAARAAGLAVIGCYHSHPDGAAQPSTEDRNGAGEENFFWLIATPAGAMAAFVYLRGVMVGADLVTSSS
ncbi:MAG: M67 family metallopeptidase [Alphaproteobacteria bacterium]|nr:M67 family metallopeptidase [Alphaproteobacteria bacterium]